MTWTRTFFDKSQWLAGPWQGEPDEVRWLHRGLNCLLLRANVTGCWCGYVGIKPGHPLYVMDNPEDVLSAYGGITYCERQVADDLHHLVPPTLATVRHAWRKYKDAVLLAASDRPTLECHEASELIAACHAGNDFGSVLILADWLEEHGEAELATYLRAGAADLLWVGFDCSHFGDICPRLEATMRRMRREVFFSSPDKYRTMAYAVSEAASLADQVIAATGACQAQT